jgi:hypothetical protein
MGNYYCFIFVLGCCKFWKLMTKNKWIGGWQQVSLVKSFEKKHNLGMEVGKSLFYLLVCWNGVETIIVNPWCQKLDLAPQEKVQNDLLARSYRI